jgi:hypothetical protein
VRNVEARLALIQREDMNGIYRFTGEDTFAASLLLMGTFWNPSNVPVNGEIVIGVPSRDQVFATGSANAEAVARMRARVQEAVRERRTACHPACLHTAQVASASSTDVKRGVGRAQPAPAGNRRKSTQYGVLAWVGATGTADEGTPSRCSTTKRSLRRVAASARSLGRPG